MFAFLIEIAARPTHFALRHVRAHSVKFGRRSVKYRTRGSISYPTCVRKPYCMFLNAGLHTRQGLATGTSSDYLHTKNLSYFGNDNPTGEGMVGADVLPPCITFFSVRFAYLFIAYLFDGTLDCFISSFRCTRMSCKNLSFRGIIFL